MAHHGRYPRRVIKAEHDIFTSLLNRSKEDMDTLANMLDWEKFCQGLVIQKRSCSETVKAYYPVLVK